MCKVVRGIMG